MGPLGGRHTSDPANISARHLLHLHHRHPRIKRIASKQNGGEVIPSRRHVIMYLRQRAVQNNEPSPPPPAIGAPPTGMNRLFRHFAGNLVCIWCPMLRSPNTLSCAAERTSAVLRAGTAIQTVRVNTARIDDAGGIAPQINHEVPFIHYVADKARCRWFMASSAWIPGRGSTPEADTAPDGGDKQEHGNRLPIRLTRDAIDKFGQRGHGQRRALP